MSSGLRPYVRLSPDEAIVFRHALLMAGLPVALSASDLRHRLAARSLSVSPSQAAQLAQGLSAVDEIQMRRAGHERPRIREIIHSGRLIYDQRDPDEHWQTYHEICQQLEGGGTAHADCEDLAALWAAEMRADQWDGRAHPIVYRVSDTLSHVVVRAPGYDARHRRPMYIDPSRLAGM